MLRPLFSRALPAALLLAGACASATQSTPAGAPSDRVLMTDAYGSVIRQSSLNDHATAAFSAPVAKVWAAAVATYADMNLPANYSDQANGRYGVRQFNFPKSLNGQRIGTYFSCGSSLTGELVDSGQISADVVTILSPAADGTTSAVIYVSAWARRNDGTSGNPVACSSTGRLEETIRQSIERKLAAG